MLARVLGSIAVQADSGETFTPSGRNQRLLLATLIARAPHAVSAGRLIDALWSDDLPADPAAALRTQVSRLRAFLARAGVADRLRRHEPSAYSLQLAPTESDAGLLAQYRRLVGEAAVPERALALATEADALWRGDPFGEFEDLVDFVGESARLRELRAALEERRAECLLAVGRASDALTVAERLAQADPLRERPQALVMQALHRAGRRHEALAAFQEYRRRLSDELGLDPSTALCALEAEILRQEGTAVDVPRSAAVASRDLSALDPPPALPLSLTALIGRAPDLAAIIRLRESSRLVTIVGPGGSGKTRLALEVARALPGHVYWTELGAITDPAFIAHAIASALGVREYTGRSRTEALLDALRRRPGTLVLDNCEHVLHACAALSDTFLRECPEVSIVATSREPLGIAGEAVWLVQPLGVPAADSADPIQVASSEAVQLFSARARAVRADFAVTVENCAAVVQVCRRLDGLPLALELAAARLRHLSLEEVARRLERDVGLLTRRGFGTQRRHQTLRDAIDWSYHLLSDAERVLLEGLSVFAGGADVQAIAAVVAEPQGIPEEQLLDLLGDLVDKSLVIADTGSARTRYRLLETVRARAAEHLQERGVADAVRARHSAHYADRADGADPLLVSARRAETGRQLELDRENLRSALAWALGPAASPEIAHRMVGSLWWFWHYAGRFAEARRWASATLALGPDGIEPRLRARVEYTAAMASWLLGDPAKACEHASESARLARQTSDASLLVRAISAHAFALRDVGEVSRAKALATECVGIARRAGFPPAEMGFALWIQCTALLESGDVEPAEVAAREAERLWRATGDHWGLSMVLNGMGMAELGRGNLEAAAGHFREAIGLLRKDGEPYFIVRSIEGLAIVRTQQGHLALASRLFGAAESLRETIGAPLLPFEQARYRRTIDVLVPGLEGRTAEDLWAQGRRLPLDDAVALSLAPAGSGA